MKKYLFLGLLLLTGVSLKAADAEALKLIEDFELLEPELQDNVNPDGAKVPNLNPTSTSNSIINSAPAKAVGALGSLIGGEVEKEIGKVAAKKLEEAAALRDQKEKELFELAGLGGLDTASLQALVNAQKAAYEQEAKNIIDGATSVKDTQKRVWNQILEENAENYAATVTAFNVLSNPTETNKDLTTLRNQQRAQLEQQLGLPAGGLNTDSLSWKKVGDNWVKYLGKMVTGK